jgi:hypothetical protein
MGGGIGLVERFRGAGRAEATNALLTPAETEERGLMPRLPSELPT